MWMIQQGGATAIVVMANQGACDDAYAAAMPAKQLAAYDRPYAKRVPHSTDEASQNPLKLSQLEP